MTVFLSLSTKQNGGQGAPAAVIVTHMGATYSGIDASVFLLILCYELTNAVVYQVNVSIFYSYTRMQQRYGWENLHVAADLYDMGGRISMQRLIFMIWVGEFLCCGWSLWYGWENLHAVADLYDMGGRISILRLIFMIWVGESPCCGWSLWYGWENLCCGWSLWYGWENIHAVADLYDMGGRISMLWLIFMIWVGESLWYGSENFYAVTDLYDMGGRISMLWLIFMIWVGESPSCGWSLWYGWKALYAAGDLYDMGGRISMLWLIFMSRNNILNQIYSDGILTCWMPSVVRFNLFCFNIG